MKKILFALIALVCSMSMNAQVMTIMKDGEVIKSYTSAEANCVVFEETPSVIKVSEITLNATTAELTIGAEASQATTTLIATVKPEAATDKTVTWASDNVEVATVTEDGVVTAVAAGTATITATANDGSGKSAACTVTVVGIEWVSLGMSKVEENWWADEPIAQVEIQQRKDDQRFFRLVKPFDAFGEELNGNQTEYLQFVVLRKGDYIREKCTTMPGIVYYNYVNTGWDAGYESDIFMMHPADMTNHFKEELWLHNKVLSYQANGLPGQVQLAPYYYMFGVGGWNKTQEDGVFVITFPGFVPEQHANIQKDFTYSEVFTGNFTSELLGTTSSATLKVGKCEVTTDDCDKRFEEEFGKVYQLADAYAPGSTLTFLVKDDKIYLPVSTVDFNYERQATGIQALGKDVYAKINPDASTFSETEVALNITFMDKDGKEFYTTTETLAKNPWVTLGVGTMTDDIIIPLYGQEPSTYNVTYEVNEDNPGLIRVVNPFGPENYPWYSVLVKNGSTMPSEGATLIINCEDPDAVYIEHQDLGMNLGDGPIGFVSHGAYLLAQGATFDAVKSEGKFGKYDKTTGKITFPVFTTESGRDYQGYVSENGPITYYAGKNGAIEFQLPTGEANSRKKVSAPAVSNKLIPLQLTKIDAAKIK